MLLQILEVTVNVHQYLADVAEVLGIASLGDGKDLVFRGVDDLGDRVLLTVC